MKSKIASAFLVLAIVAGSASAASAACKVDHWTNGLTEHPVFKCDGQAST